MCSRVGNVGRPAPSMDVLPQSSPCLFSVHQSFVCTLSLPVSETSARLLGIYILSGVSFVVRGNRSLWLAVQRGRRSVWLTVALGATATDRERPDAIWREYGGDTWSDCVSSGSLHLLAC